MAVLGKPQTKCEHGVFKAGEAIARYCSYCNPVSMYTTHGRKEMKLDHVQIEVAFDADEVLQAA